MGKGGNCTGHVALFLKTAFGLDGISSKDFIEEIKAVKDLLKTKNLLFLILYFNQRKKFLKFVTVYCVEKNLRIATSIPVLTGKGHESLVQLSEGKKSGITFRSCIAFRNMKSRTKDFTVFYYMVAEVVREKMRKIKVDSFHVLADDLMNSDTETIHFTGILLLLGCYHPGH